MLEQSGHSPRRALNGRTNKQMTTMIDPIRPVIGMANISNKQKIQRGSVYTIMCIGAGLLDDICNDLRGIGANHVLLNTQSKYVDS